MKRMTTNLSYDIEMCFLEGMSDMQIAQALQITIEEVEAWMTLNGLAVDEEKAPYYGA